MKALGGEQSVSASIKKAAARVQSVYMGKGKGAYREHAAAVVSLLQLPQRTLQLRVASIPEVHLESLKGNDAKE